MNESQHQQSQTRWLPNILMIILETLFTFILKHDRLVRLQSQSFIDKQITLKINSYLPYFDFYVQFTTKGILFDVQAPEKAVDLTLSSTLLDLLQAFLFGNRRSMHKMRIEGDDTVLKDELRDLVLHFSAPKLLSDWKQWLSNSDDDAQTTASRKRIAPLLEKIDQQRSKINSLQVEVKQYQNRIRRIEQRQKRINITFALITLLLIGLLVYNLCFA